MKQKEKYTEQFRNLVNGLGLFSSIMLILLLIVTLVGTLRFGVDMLNSTSDVSEELFILGILIAVVTIIGQWIAGRYNYFCDLLETFKPKENKREVTNGISKKSKGRSKRR